MATVDIDGTAYPSYSDLETADLYLAASLNTGNWDAASDDTKGKALVEASRLLDRQPWPGEKAVSTSPVQPLAWPRVDTGIEGVEPDVIPENIVFASIEIARALLDGADLLAEQNTSQKIQSMQAGSVSMTFFRGAEGEAYRFPLIIQELLAPYLGTTGLAIAGAFVSGVDGYSSTRKTFGFSGPI